MNSEESNTQVAYGVSTCSGCGLELIMRSVMNALGENTIIVIPPGCAALFSGFGINTSIRIPGFQGNLENTAAYAAGIRTGLDVQGKTDINVLAFAGDGATVDIGLQSLSGLFERRERVMYLCYDNEAYMNTGGQRSGSTPLGSITTTTPKGKLTPKKDMFTIAAAHHIPYIASASIGDIKDLKRKVIAASLVDGPSYIHVHCPCPTGWGFEENMTVSVARDAIECGAWQLFEIINDEKTINYVPKGNVTMDEYLSKQSRFLNK